MHTQKQFALTDRVQQLQFMRDDYVDKLLAAIVGFEIAIERIEGSFKLSQNRSAADRAGVINALLQSAPSDQALAHLMQRIEKSS